MSVIMLNVPICRDCKYNEKRSSHREPGAFDYCHYPHDISLVSGEIVVMFADHARKWSDKCGRNGRHFEPKEKSFDSVIDHNPEEFNHPINPLRKFLEIFK